MTQLFFSDYHDDDHDTPDLRPLVIVGAGGLGREILVLVRQLNEAHPTWDVLGFYDDHRPGADLPLPYLGTTADLAASTAPVAVAVAIGNGGTRAAVVQRLQAAHLRFPALVHPSVALAPYQQLYLGAGCLITQGCILTTNVRLGRHVLLNLGCTLGHDAVLEDFCSLMPHANVGGEAHLETGVYLGTNATVLNRVRVGAGTTVGAGAVVVRDLPAHCTAVGVPAKTINNEQLPMRNEQPS